MVTRKTALRAPRTPDAIALLKADHANVKKMFKEFQKLHKSGAHDEAQGVALTICKELTVHTTIEEEIFYPEVRAVIKDSDLMDEATVEHASAKELIAQIKRMKVSQPLYVAKVTVLGEQIDHHVKEEQEDMFPKARKSNVDLKEMGVRMAARKQELMSQMG